MVDIQSTTAEIRRGKERKIDRKIEEETTGKYMMACPIPYGAIMTVQHTSTYRDGTLKTVADNLFNNTLGDTII